MASPLSPPPSPAAGAPYAAVAVDVPVRPKPTGGVASTPTETFTYAVPERLEGALRPGARVIVPFGKRRMIGVVTAFVAEAPSARLRDIIDAVDSEPLITAADLTLATWMAGHYLAPLYACLALFLPPLSSGRIETAYRRTRLAVGDLPSAISSAAARSGASAAPNALETTAVASGTTSPSLSPVSVDALAVLGLFKDHHPAGERVLRHRAREAGIAPAALHRALRELVASGLVYAASPLAAKTPGPRTQTVIALASADAGEVRRRLADLYASGRRSEHYRQVVEHLMDAGQPLAWSEVAAKTEASTAIRATLEAAGIVVTRRVSVRSASEGEWLAGGDADTVGSPLAPLTETPTTVHFQPGSFLEDGPRSTRAQPPHALTRDQQAAWDLLTQEILPVIVKPSLPEPPFDAAPHVVLLRGVTGSGKTELYLRAIDACLAAGRQAIVLVPEIALTPQTVARFEQRFPGQVGVWHSDMATGERVLGWRRAKAGQVGVIAGARSALFAPMPNLGLIVVDEEHADSFKQEEPAPRYDARVVAVERARRAGAAVIFGSATPSAEAHFRVQQGAWRLAVLPRRVGAALDHDAAEDAAGVSLDGPAESGHGDNPRTATTAKADAHIVAGLPPVTIVDMRTELKEGNRSIFSRPLAAALGQVLARGEQAILFLNRRGSATFVLCRDCGHVLACPRCKLPLTWHGTGAAGPVHSLDRSGGPLVCHRCNFRTQQPMLCPECSSTRIRYFGTGTQRVEEEVRFHFPAARLLRWDADTTTKRGGHAALLQRFASGQADVLVGTQMIAKGLDLPLVTLVGVILADTGLALPDLWASERTFQLLTQVAGRAGRAHRPGEVIFQTYNPDHTAIQFAARHDYDGFMAQELAFRHAQGYPPYRTLVKLVYRTATDAAAERAAKAMADDLRRLIAELGLAGVTLLGPAQAFFGRLRGLARWQLLLLAPDPHTLLRHVDVGPGWVVDVEPVTVL